MIIEQQESEIRNYLLSKKLPIDILIEVNDHFISQISDLQREENLSFEEAFLKVKTRWNFEFILFRKNFFSSKTCRMYLPKSLGETEPFFKNYGYSYLDVNLALGADYAQVLKILKML